MPEQDDSKFKPADFDYEHFLATIKSEAPAIYRQFGELMRTYCESLNSRSLTGEDKFSDYCVQINWTSSTLFDPKKETVEVIVSTKDGQEYEGHFTARGFIDYMFEKNARTGECAGGTYFCMPKLILVSEITEDTIKLTIDDMIKNFELEDYFKKVD